MTRSFLVALRSEWSVCWVRSASTGKEYSFSAAGRTSHQLAPVAQSLSGSSQAVNSRGPGSDAGNEAGAEGQHGGLYTGSASELVQHAADVGLHGGLAQEEHIADLAFDMPCAIRQDSALAVSEPAQPCPS